MLWDCWDAAISTCRSHEDLGRLDPTETCPSTWTWFLWPLAALAFNGNLLVEDVISVHLDQVYWNILNSLYHRKETLRCASSFANMEWQWGLFTKESLLRSGEQAWANRKGALLAVELLLAIPSQRRWKKLFMDGQKQSFREAAQKFGTEMIWGKLIQDIQVVVSTQPTIWKEKFLHKLWGFLSGFTWICFSFLRQVVVDVFLTCEGSIFGMFPVPDCVLYYCIVTVLSEAWWSKISEEWWSCLWSLRWGPNISTYWMAMKSPAFSQWSGWLLCRMAYLIVHLFHCKVPESVNSPIKTKQLQRVALKLAWKYHQCL